MYGMWSIGNLDDLMRLRRYLSHIIIKGCEKSIKSDIETDYRSSKESKWAFPMEIRLQTSSILTILISQLFIPYAIIKSQLRCPNYSFISLRFRQQGKKVQGKHLLFHL